MAEKGLIQRIGKWVLNQAVADWATLRPFCTHNARHKPFVSINLSAPELAGGEIVREIQSCLERNGMLPSELRIELTETIIIQNMELVSQSLLALRALGVGIALDDFGTGYAGLDYLQSLPFTCLKIDKTFVQQIGQSERSVHIIKAALALARSIGLSTIAEGIEDRATGDALVLCWVAATHRATTLANPCRKTKSLPGYATTRHCSKQRPLRLLVDHNKRHNCSLQATVLLPQNLFAFDVLWINRNTRHRAHLHTLRFIKVPHALGALGGSIS